MRRVGAGLASRGVGVATFDFPYKAAGRALPDKASKLEDAFAAVWREVAATVPAGALFAGGKSMGGRIASQTAARGAFVPPPAGLVYFGYPLHPPGKPAQRNAITFLDLAGEFLALAFDDIEVVVCEIAPLLLRLALELLPISFHAIPIHVALLLI
jgi:predicted alpha/beta-hydrolase family hydrolase